MMTLLRRQRLAAGLSMSALARVVRVTPAAVCRWEQGRSLPKPAHIRPIAFALGIDPMTLVNIVTGHAAADRREAV